VSGSEPSGDGRTELGEPPPRVLLYSKPGCHLCDDAREIVAAVCAELGERFDEVDITTSEELVRAFGEQIPVTFVDGEQHDFWRVDPVRLRAALV
jgi:glutaredoxin